MAWTHDFSVVDATVQTANQYAILIWPSKLNLIFTTAIVHDPARTSTFYSLGAVSDVRLAFSEVVVHVHVVAKLVGNGLEQKTVSRTNCGKILVENL